MGHKRRKKQIKSPDRYDKVWMPYKIFFPKLYPKKTSRVANFEEHLVTEYDFYFSKTEAEEMKAWYESRKQLNIRSFIRGKHFTERVRKGERPSTKYSDYEFICSAFGSEFIQCW